MDKEMSKEQQRIEVAKRLLERDGFEFSKEYQKEKGCDLIARKDGKMVKIEVKTTESIGISDAFQTEFQELGSEPVIKAHYLVVVRKKGEKIFGSNLISKEDVERYKAQHKMVKHVKLSRELQREAYDRKLGKWLAWEED